MSAALTLAAIGILASVFFGLGGADLAFGAKDQIDQALKRRTEESDKSRRKSERDAENNTKNDETVPKSRKVSNRQRIAEDKKIAERIKETAARNARTAEDISRLDKRRARKPTRIRGFKKSGAEVTRQKNIEEIKAMQSLTGFNTGIRGKLGREKRFVNKNFDLGLPNTATQAERDFVIRRQNERNARRKVAAAKRNNIAVGEKKLSGKSKTELLAIAKKRGLNFNTDISAKSLSRALLATGGLN